MVTFLVLGPCLGRSSLKDLRLHHNYHQNLPTAILRVIVASDMFPEHEQSVFTFRQLYTSLVPCRLLRGPWGGHRVRIIRGRARVSCHGYPMIIIDRPSRVDAAI